MSKNTDLPPKRINQKALVRLFTDIKRLKSDDIRFCFLIGAGASASSEIPTGWALSQRWYNELKDGYFDDAEIRRWEKVIGASFAPENIGEFYPFLYGKRYESAPQVGYEEFQKLMENKEPSLGYIILSQILANEKHNFVITTNFDYLIEDAVRMYTPKKPFIAGHETLAEFISSQTERPTIIKVHRDLFLHPFNDNETTSELKAEWKKALAPLMKNFQLLVLGYGGNDGSLMDYMSSIPADDRKPIYWCLRKNGRPNTRMQKLLTCRDFIAEIDGFDELMHALYNALGYSILADLESPESHPFVINAKERLARVGNQLKAIVNRYREMKEEVSEDVKQILKGAAKYLSDAYEEKDENKKREIFREGLAQYPDDAYLNAYYAAFLYDTGNAVEGDKYYQKAIGIKPDYHVAFYNWGTDLGNLAVTKTGKEAEELYRLAFGKYREAVRIKPDMHEAFNGWGYYLGKLAATISGREAEDLYRLAFEKYAEAVRIKPDFHDAFYNWGNDLGKLAATISGREAEDLYRLACEKYAEAVRIKPDYHEAFYNWGTDLGKLAATKSGREAEDLYRLAFEKYGEAVRIKPDKHEAFYNWGYDLGKLAETKSGREADDLYRLACEKFGETVRIKPDKHDAFYNWGIYLGKLAATKSSQEAEDLYRLAFEKYAEAVRIKPDYHEAFSNWGIYLGKLAATKSGHEAEDLYRLAFEKYGEAVRIKPDYHEVFYNWGIYLGKLAVTKSGREAEDLYRLAEEKYRKSIDLGGDGYNLACLHAIRNSKSDALRYLEISLSRKFVTPGYVLDDNDWKNFLDDADFRALLAKYASDSSASSATP